MSVDLIVNGRPEVQGSVFEVGELGMANLTLVYGMRLLPADEVA